MPSSPRRGRPGPLRRAGEAEGFDYATGSTIRLELYAAAAR